MPTKIEWTHGEGFIGETWNPVVGCSYASDGCTNCYAATLAAGRLSRHPAYQGVAEKEPDRPARFTGIVRCRPDKLLEPLSWRQPRMIFANSMSDTFHRDVPDEFVDQMFGVMALTPRHVYQVLTKRPQRMAKWTDRNFLNEPRSALVAAAVTDVSWHRKGKPVVFESREAFQHAHGPYDRRPWPGWPLPNVWMGTSIESNHYVWRAEYLRKVDARVRFLSLEPLRGPLPDLDLTGIDWVITGGESGMYSRPAHPRWFREIRDRCLEAGIPYFHKQNGSWAWAVDIDVQREPDLYIHYDGRTATEEEAIADGGSWTGVYKLGKKRAGRRLDGELWDQMPAVA